MQLNDLFVSHKQVEPVAFEKDTPDFDMPIYYNRARAQQATSQETQKEVDSALEAEDMTTWKVGGDYTATWSAKSKSSDYNNALRKFIIDSEGFREEAYQDGKYYSIGYGFNGPQYKKGDRMTREEADAELTRQLSEREGRYKKRFGYKWDNLSDNQKIALMSYGYNTGDGNIIGGNVAKYLDAGDMTKLRDSLTINTVGGVYNAGLDNRRKRERALFNS